MRVSEDIDLKGAFNERIKEFEETGEILNEENNFEEPYNEGVSEEGSDDSFFDNEPELEVAESPQEEIESLGKPGAGRVVLTVLFGMVFCALFSFIVYSLYMRYIKYPDREELVYEESGLYCLENWMSDISELKSGEYISKEIEYANGNEERTEFYKKMLSTVEYTPGETTVKNVYGNDYIDKETNDVEYTESWVSEGEEVTLSYVDYDKIEFDKDTVKSLMQEAELKAGDADYNNKLVNVFCSYMNSLETLPEKSVSYTPNISKEGNKYKVLPEEDIYLDTLLFSSDEFNGLIYRFSEVAGKTTGGKKLKNFQPTKEWKKWNKLAKKKKSKVEEPEKYTYKQLCSTSWCGTYNLINNGIQEVPELGNGTFEDPADIGTGILTNWLQKEKGKLVRYPIKVKMIEYGVSEDAIKWFESKDERNRGIDITSEAQYCYYVFEVTNLSGKTLTIKDNSSLADSSANLSSRTGELYGITDTVKLKPDETGIVESWSRSTELNKKYVIWGANFERREEPVWFRVLMGDLEDTSEEKGVTINKSRSESGLLDDSETDEYSDDYYDPDADSAVDDAAVDFDDGGEDTVDSEDDTGEEDSGEVESGYID